MQVEAIASMADEFDITPELAREILLTYSDQLPPPPPTGEEPREPTRPPAREVDPFWKFSTFWQIAEPTVAWPLGVYNMAKLGMASGAGLPARAGLPKALGGMSARELWASARNPKTAETFQTWYSAPKGTVKRPTIPRALTPKIPKGTPSAARNLPNVISTSSWAQAAGPTAIIAGGLLAREYGARFAVPRLLGPAAERARRERPLLQRILRPFPSFRP